MENINQKKCSVARENLLAAEGSSTLRAHAEMKSQRDLIL